MEFGKPKTQARPHTLEVIFFWHVNHHSSYEDLDKSQNKAKTMQKNLKFPSKCDFDAHILMTLHCVYPFSLCLYEPAV